ncbi:MAG: ASKHA domain-containing protein [Candidatus Omnitrophica bacterium]|nr:ASKHA domain-containing protein [Candidatus Omnitrophota bacterium]
MDKFKVTFLPDNKIVEVAKDTTILSAALSSGVCIKSDCGGDGVCGRCKVIVKKGRVLSQPSGLISAEDRKHNVHLACITTIHSDLEIEIPLESRLELTLGTEGIYSVSENVESGKKILSEISFKYCPLSTKLYLELPLPSLNDTASDLDRIFRGIRKTQNLPFVQTGLSNIRQLGELLRDSDWKVTVTLGKINDTLEIILVEPGDTSNRNFGICFDIGTTTISCQLVSLSSKKVLGTKAAYNKQAGFGSDVITRIIYSRQEEGMEKLHSAVTETMNQMIKELTVEHRVDLNDITCVVCAGNTTMIHLLLRVDPTYIKREPYVSTANFLPVLRAHEAGIIINPRGLLFCVPGVSSYVGGDTTSGVLSSGLYKEEGLSLLIDIGTNGEICLGSKDFLAACAASAGPAFEGSGVACGMRASTGAIQKVKIDAKSFSVTCSTIGDARPCGICGSGYIDLIASMLETGVIDRSGRIKLENHMRVRDSEAGKEFVLIFKEDSATSKDIVINEADIENLKRAKAAIYSAVSVLIKRMNFEFNDVKKIFIAGGFGTSLDVDNAIKIGLLPDVKREKIVFIGNSALSGARQMLLSIEASKKTDEIARKITYFELSADPGYMDEYMSALFFPHTDLNRFSSAK